MDDTQDILDEFFSNYSKLEGLSKHKHNELSKVDLEISDYYHTIEGIHLSHNTQGHSLILQLKDILDRRRQLKRETILIRSFMDTTQKAMSTAKGRSVKILNKHHNLMKELKNNSKKFDKN